MFDQSTVKLLAEEYATAPPGIPAGLQALCDEFAAWNRQRATQLARVFRIENTEDEVPYPTAESLFEGITENGIFQVPLTYWNEPAYDVETNIALRIVHDLDGHYASGQGFTLEEECIAYAHQAAITPLKFVPLVFSEVLHQLCFTTHFRTFPTVQKPFITEHRDLIWSVLDHPEQVALDSAVDLVRCSQGRCFSLAGECNHEFVS